MISLVYTINAENFVSVFFLAVKKEHQGKGYGSKMMHYSQKRGHKKEILTRGDNLENTGLSRIGYRFQKKRRL